MDNFITPEEIASWKNMLTIKQVAEAEGIKICTVYSRIHRGWYKNILRADLARMILIDPAELGQQRPDGRSSELRSNGRANPKRKKSGKK